MGWESKLSYPPDARCKVSVKATDYQKGRWEKAARLRGMATAGAFLAWAGDLVLALQRAYEDAAFAHHDALNPVGYAEDVKRREERAQERVRREEE